MDSKELVLIELIKTMGGIIRELDSDNEFSEYWLNDGDYVHALEVLKINKDDESERI